MTKGWGSAMVPPFGGNTVLLTSPPHSPLQTLFMYILSKFLNETGNKKYLVLSNVYNVVN